MAGQLDSLFKSAAKSVIADLGKSLDCSITYTVKGSPSYNVTTGALTTTDTAYSIKVPFGVINSGEAEEGQEKRRAKLYLTPNLINDHQPTFDDTVTLSYAGSDQVAQIVNIDTYKGLNEYLFILEVVF